MKKILFTILALSVGNAYTSDLTLEAVIDVKPVCTTQVQDISFGRIQLKSMSEKIKVPNTVSTQCNYGTKVTIEFDSGRNGFGNDQNIKRYMVNDNNDKLEYNLFFEDKVLSEMSYVQNNAVEVRQFFGELDLNQKAPEGDYIDTITVNFIFE